jgi:hypothetical protein
MNARDITPATIAMPEVQRRRPARITLTKRLQMLTADLTRGLYAIANLTHDSSERCSSAAPRSACEMRAAQLLINPTPYRSSIRNTHIRTFPAGNIPAFPHRERPDVH